jgi:hypothetical protein
VSGRWFPGLTPSRPAPVDVDTGVPHPARSYDYILGGKDNFYPPGGGTAGAYNRAGIPFQYWARDESGRFVAGLQPVPPGIVPMPEWRADDEPQPRPSPLEAGGYVAVACKD